MRKKRLYYLLICFALGITLISALPYSIVQADDTFLNFEKPSIDPEIGAVRSFLQDHYGYLWFGTEYNLVRYDGTETILYQYSCSGNNSIPGLCTVAIYESTDGSIWVCTEGGLGRLDRKDETFQRYTHDPDNPESISHNLVATLVEDRDGILWIGTLNGLNSLDLESGNLTRYYNNPDDPESISNSNITVIFEDSEGTLWIGTEDGLNRFNKDSGTFSRHYYTDNGNDSLGINTIHQTEDGVLWLGTNSGLVLNLDNNSGSLVPSPVSPDDYSGHNIVNINTIFEDEDGMMWIGTNNGLIRYDRDKSSLKYYGDDENSASLPGNISIVYSIGQSREGILWFGTSSGLYSLNQNKSVFTNYTSNMGTASAFSGESVTSFCESDDGCIWVGALGALYKFEQETGELTSHDESSSSDAGNPTFYQSGMTYEDSKGYIWTIAFGAICRFDPETGTTSVYCECGGESAGMVNKIFEDSDGNIVLGTGDGVFRFDSNSCQFVNYFSNPDLVESLKGDIVWEICEDSYGYLWIGTDFSVYAVNKSDEVFSRYTYSPINENSPAGYRIKTIMEDSGGDIWVGTSNGFSKFDRDTSEITNYRIEDGLPSNIICGFLEDDNDHIWISTNNGLSRFDTYTEAFTNYDGSNGLEVNNFNWRACYKAPDGELFFGGINGFVSFYPEELLMIEPVVPSVLINGFTAYRGKNEIDHDQPIEEMEEITLPYSSNSFGIDFVAINYTSPEDNAYAYLLDGFDKSWSYTSGMRNSATYTNIPSGEYVFKVKAASSDGVWNIKGVSLKITITPPFWQEWWFMLLLIMASLLLIFAVVRLRTHALHTRAQQLENQVAERTAQLVDKTDQLGKEVQRRVYFTRSLVHELKTPLTPVLGASEALADQLKNEKLKGLAKNIYNGASQLNNRINELLDLARGEIDMLKLDIHDVDMASLLQEVTRYSSAQAAKRKLSLSLDLPDSLPVISADESRINQVVSNLIDNAIKFTPERGSITVKAEENDGSIFVEVSDSGPGIAKGLQKRLFQPYYRIESDREHLSGLGLGLALSKILVELHGGKIWVESHRGKGCAFTFSLPLSNGNIKPDENMEVVDENSFDRR